MSGLRDYYELDFPKTAVVRYELKAVYQEQIIDKKFFAQAHIDFTSHVKFCSFYIPNELCDNLLEMCKAALAYSRDVLALRGGTQVTLPKADSTWTGQAIQLRANEYLDMNLVPLEGQSYSVSDFSIAPPLYIYAEADLAETQQNEILDLGKRYNVIVRLRGPKYAKRRSDMDKPLAFISHDSRDKDLIAGPIAQGLTRMGISVWYAEYTLKPGDRLRESIEKGLKECKKCILVLTPNFLGNAGWTATEFNTIFTREIIEESALVIPVWYGVSKKDVYEYSPSLVNVLGAIWSETDPDKVIREISRALDS